MSIGEKVIVRAYGDEPLERTVCSIGRRVVHVCRPDTYDAFLEGVGGAVGFPHEDVFKFDEGALNALCRAWEGDRPSLSASWSRAERYVS